ncbi:putative protein far1-related sequence 10 [Nicotiana attenuata]|uniref:Protein FAR1-RELATED SEQUENCE n=1 Tax=Nicotiana attenuata TaxID=49451 RepID=A0A1J6K8V5_NICAT|nr:putative protein far1-related sequence 10 [Nicotiana attenuata]
MMKSSNDNNEFQSLRSTFGDLTLESLKTKGRLEYAKKESQRVLQIVQCFPENEHMSEEHEHVSISQSIESNSLGEDYHIFTTISDKGKKKRKKDSKRMDKEAIRALFEVVLNLKITSKGGNTNSHNSKTGTTTTSNEELRKENVIHISDGDLQVGKVFDSDDEAYNYYMNFAKSFGFSVRRDRHLGSVEHPMGIYKKDYVCHRAGIPRPQKVVEKERQRNRKSSRCNCKAKMSVAKDIFDGITRWTVVYFDNVHNHELLSDKEKRDRIRKGSRSGQLPFTEKDIRNFVQSESSTNIESDALELLKICKSLKDKDVDFQYDFIVDGCQRLEHVIWAFGDSIHAYDVFGDLVVFDTTYRLNRYEMPLGVWIGVDNHVATVVSIRNHAGEEPTMRQKYYNPQIKKFMAIEKHASKVLTPFAFELLQDEMILSVEYGLFPHTDGSYLVRHYSKTDGGRFVYWNSIEEVVQCSYQKFEFSGILCRRSIRVINAHNYFMLPDKYLLARWRQENPLVLKFTHMMKSSNNNNEFQSLHSTFRDLTLESLKTKDEDYHIENPQQSHTKGRKKGKRLAGGNEAAKKLRYCKVPNCGGTGHDSRILCRHSIRALTAHNYFMLPDKYLLARWRQENPFVLKFTHMMKSSNDNNEFESLHSTFRDLILESLKTKGRLEYAKQELQRVLQIDQCFPENEHLSEEHEHVSISQSIESNSLDEDYHIENSQQSQTKGRKRGKRLVGGIKLQRN